MLPTTHTLRHAAAGIVLAGALGVIAVPQALASSSPRTGYRSAIGSSADGRAIARVVAQQEAARPPRLGSFDGRSPDTIDAALSAELQRAVIADGRSPDTLDASQAVQALRFTPVDGRSPDTVDFAVQAHSPVVTVVRSPGFAWGDFGIGVAAAVGAMLLLASTRLLTARFGRKQTSPVATA